MPCSLQCNTHNIAAGACAQHAIMQAIMSHARAALQWTDKKATYLSVFQGSNQCWVLPIGMRGVIARVHRH